MIRSTVTPAALLLAFVPMLSQAVDGVPVEDRNGTGSRSAAPALSQPQPSATTQPAAIAAPASAVSANAQLLMMLEQLQEEVQYLRGQVEQQQNQIRRMQTDQRDRYRDLDRRITRLNQQPVMTPGSSLPPALPSTLPAAGSDSSVTAPEPASASTDSAGTSPSGVSDAQAYKEAFALVRGNNFDAALGAFERFLQQYPQSTLTANVLYWTGEVHRAKPRPEPQLASQAYQQLIERFPDHSKASDALYKLGLSQQELGHAAEAKASMQRVISQFPDSSSANLAREFLKQQR